MFHSKRHEPMRIALAIATALATISLGLATVPAFADEPIGEEIEVPPPAPKPAPAPVTPAPAPAPEEAFFLYVSGNVGGSFARVDSDGTNLAGLFPNRGIDHDQDAFGGGALGIGWKASDVFGVRVEFEGEGGRGYDFTTLSCIFPQCPYPYFYETNVQSYNLMGNIWLDFPLTDVLSVFAGGGLGAAVTDIDTSDGTVSGRSHDDTTFAWQVGGGVSVNLTDWLALDTSYRYLDLGQPDLNFFNGNGDYELDLTSHEVVLGVRFNFLSF